MLVVALDFRGPSKVALDEDWICISAQRDRRRVEHGAARDDVLGLANVRNNRLKGQLSTSRHAGEAERSSHDLKEPAARNAVEPFGSALGEFAMQSFPECGTAGQF